jgi:hypothetical protein
MPHTNQSICTLKSWTLIWEWEKDIGFPCLVVAYAIIIIIIIEKVSIRKTKAEIVTIVT